MHDFAPPLKPAPGTAPSQTLENHGKQTGRCPCGVRSLASDQWRSLVLSSTHLVPKHCLWPVTSERWPWGRDGERGEGNDVRRDCLG